MSVWEEYETALLLKQSLLKHLIKPKQSSNIIKATTLKSLITHFEEGALLSALRKELDDNTLQNKISKQ